MKFTRCTIIWHMDAYLRKTGKMKTGKMVSPGDQHSCVSVWVPQTISNVDVDERQRKCTKWTVHELLVLVYDLLQIDSVPIEFASRQ